MLADKSHYILKNISGTCTPLEVDMSAIIPEPKGDGYARYFSNPLNNYLYFDRKLNSRLQFVLGDKIWQNYQTYEFKNLAPALQDNKGTYTNFQASEINDTGLVVGKAIKKSDSTSHAVLLIPIEINAVSYLNKSPGKPTTTASNICVGEPVTVSIGGALSSAGVSITDYNWNLPNAIKDYIASDNSAKVKELETSDTSSPSVTFYYPVVSANGVTSGSVSCDLTLSTGDKVTINGSLKVVAPTGQLTKAMLSPSYSTSGTTAAIFLGNPPHTTHHGFEYSCTNYPPPETPGFTSGTFYWVQVLNSATVTGKDLYKSTTGLDGGFPYSSNLGGHDSPAQAPITPQYSPVTRSDSFSLYFMFKPNVPNARFVPLQQLDWWWGETVTYTPRHMEGAPGTWAPSGAYSGNSGWYSATAEPEWSREATVNELQIPTN